MKLTSGKIDRLSYLPRIIRGFRWLPLGLHALVTLEVWNRFAKRHAPRAMQDCGVKEMHSHRRHFRDQRSRARCTSCSVCGVNDEGI